MAEEHKEEPAVPVVAAAAAATEAGAPDDDDLDDFLDEFQDEVLSQPPGSGAPAATGDGGDDDAELARLLQQAGLDDPESKAQFEQFLRLFGGEAAGGAAGSTAEDAASGDDFQLIMKDTMLRLKSSGSAVDEQLKAEQATDIFSLLGGAGEGSMAELLTQMMEQLLLKEVLYEPMRDLNDKYPGWLEENRGTLLEADLARYLNQFAIVKDIVAKFDEPGYLDLDKPAREYITDKLEQLQQLGDPPKELVGDLDQLGGMFGGSGNDGELAEIPDDFDLDSLPPEMRKNLEETVNQCPQQ